MSQLHCYPKLAIFGSAVVILLSSACTLFPSAPPPPPPPPPPENNPPIIHVMTVEKEATTLAECQVSCRATDDDGDNLSYWWTADGGTIKGEGSSIVWIASEAAGDYTITVMVTDGKGGEATDSATISVIQEPNQPPVIVNLELDGSQPDEENRIRIWRTATIECFVEDMDGDELSYTWSATGGKVQGGGRAVGWIAPGQAGNYTVTVNVTDGKGGEDSAIVAFKVLCCGR